MEINIANMIYSYVENGSCDLHLHTHYSDGADSVVSLVQKVMANRLKVFAVTDHDCIDAIPEVLRLLRRLRELGFVCPDFIPGIEISAEFSDAGQSKEIHVLGYFPSGGHEEMAGFVNEQRKKRNERNMEMCRCLTEFGMPVTIEELNAEGQKSVGRLHAANILMRKGYISSVKEGFDTLFGYGKPCYIMRDKPNAQEAIRTIRNAGGFAVIAHPYLYKWTGSGSGKVAETLETALAYLKEAGIEGVEAFHGEASPDQREETYAATLAAGLVPTAGSDYHGENKNGVKMYTFESAFIENDTTFEAAALIEHGGKYLVLKGEGLSDFGGKTFFPGISLSASGVLDPVQDLEKFICNRFSEKLKIAGHYLTAYERKGGSRRILSVYKATGKVSKDELLRYISYTGKGKAVFAGLQELSACDMSATHALVVSNLREMTLFTV